MIILLPEKQSNIKAYTEISYYSLKSNRKIVTLEI
jgi:hypothetical protein